MSSKSCPANFIHSNRKRLHHLAQPEHVTDCMQNPPLRHDGRLFRPHKLAEDIMREEIKAGGSVLVGTTTEKGLEIFHQSLGSTPPKAPQTREDQIYPLQVALGGDTLEEERKKKDLKTLLQRRATKMKVDREVNMRLHANLNGIYCGFGSGEDSQQAGERLRAHERWGVAGLLGANIDTHEEEANIPQMERFDVARPPSSRCIPCNHARSYNRIWRDYMNKDFREFAPEPAEGEKRRQTEVAKGDGKMGEELANGVKKQMVERLTDNNKEMDSKSGGLKREVTKEGEAKKNKEAKGKLNKKVKESLQPEELGVKHENGLEEEYTDEVGVGEDTRDYTHAATECDGYRRTNEQLHVSPLDHQSQQSLHPHNLKSKWVIVNDFAEDGEEFVFVEKDV